jgi:hypothetical protein
MCGGMAGPVVQWRWLRLKAPSAEACGSGCNSCCEAVGSPTESNRADDCVRALLALLFRCGRDQLSHWPFLYHHHQQQQQQRHLRAYDLPVSTATAMAMARQSWQQVAVVGVAVVLDSFRV